jgi:hypothetical protein
MHMSLEVTGFEGVGQTSGRLPVVKSGVTGVFPLSWRSFCEILQVAFGENGY